MSHKERIDRCVERIDELDEWKESAAAAISSLNIGLSNLYVQLSEMKGPDDRKEVRELQLAVRRLEAMVRGAIDREQDRTLPKPTNKGSVSIHTEALVERLQQVALEERNKILAYLENAVGSIPFPEIKANIRAGLHLAARPF
jgi:hypothetical protein